MRKTGNLLVLLLHVMQLVKSDDELIEKVMTRNPITVTGKTSVASAGHSMIWEGIDLLPVVTDAGMLAWNY